MMGIALIGTVWMALLLTVLVATVEWSIRRKAYASMSWTGIAMSTAPGIVMLLTFYALALHMHAALGGWPKAIGNAGFPPGLVQHDNATSWYFPVMLLAVFLAWPVALAICSAVARLRRFIPHLSLFAGSFVVNLALMLLGPSQFLDWWWD